MAHALINVEAAAEPQVWNHDPDHDGIVVSFDFRGIGQLNIKMTNEQAEALAIGINQVLQDANQPPEVAEWKEMSK